MPSFLQSFVSLNNAIRSTSERSFFDGYRIPVAEAVRNLLEVFNHLCTNLIPEVVRSLNLSAFYHHLTASTSTSWQFQSRYINKDCPCFEIRRPLSRSLCQSFAVANRHHHAVSSRQEVRWKESVIISTLFEQSQVFNFNGRAQVACL